MKTIFQSTLFAFTFTFMFFNAHAQIREFYQIKIYTFENEEQERMTDEFLENAFIPALNRQKIERIGVFKNRKDTDADSIRKTFVIVPYISLFQFHSLEDQLAIDKKYLKDGEAYLNAPYDKAPYQRIESILLKAFEDMPMLKPSAVEGPRQDRIYELRSYESATENIFANKVEMFNSGGEIILFEKLDFNAVFYGAVISGSKMPNLMYMTTHKNKAERKTNWEQFFNSEEWKTLSSMEKYQNNVSHIDIYFLYPTSYSSY